MNLSECVNLVYMVCCVLIQPDLCLLNDEGVQYYERDTSPSGGGRLQLQLNNSNHIYKKPNTTSWVQMETNPEYLYLWVCYDCDISETDSEKFVGIHVVLKNWFLKSHLEYNAYSSSTNSILCSSQFVLKNWFFFC